MSTNTNIQNTENVVLNAENQVINATPEITLSTRVLSENIMAKAVKVDYTRKDKAAAAKKLKTSWIEAEGSLNSRVKWLLDNKDSVSVIEFFAKLGLKSKDVLKKEILTPALIVENWGTKDELGVCIRLRTVYTDQLDADDNKIVDYYYFETKAVWSISDVVRMLQRVASKKVPTTSIYETTSHYHKINGKFVLAPSADIAE